jgi:histidine triad (HIT) family protein
LHNHTPEDYVCPFCSLVQGEQSEHVYSVPTDIVYQNDHVAAFVSSHQWPNNPGNVIIVPREHFENIYDLPVHLAARVQELARAIALAMKAAWACDGISTRQHNEPAGNQDVWHYHVHVTPRYTGDEFYTLYAGQRVLMPADERAKYAEELREHLRDWEVDAQ